MIEGLVLPNLASPAQSLVDAMSRFTLDRMHDLWNGKGTVFVGQGRENQVDMVWHYYGSVQNAFPAVDMCAGFESHVPGEVGEMPALMCGKSYEKSTVIFLDVRQVSASVVVPAWHG